MNHTLENLWQDFSTLEVLAFKVLTKRRSFEVMRVFVPNDHFEAHECPSMDNIAGLSTPPGAVTVQWWVKCDTKFELLGEATDSQPL